MDAILNYVVGAGLWIGVLYVMFNWDRFEHGDRKSQKRKKT